MNDVYSHVLPLSLAQSVVDLEDQGFSSWVPSLDKELKDKFAPGKNGNIPRWLDVLSSLPNMQTSVLYFGEDAVKIGDRDEVSDSIRSEIECALLQMSPWRKGPFDLFGIGIDSEWQSNLKWRRIQKAITSLAGKRVLDVGCGNGYYAFRMLGQEAKWVLGVDPSALALFQFSALSSFISIPFPITFLPVGMESIPRRLEDFDVVFSMGVLYHRRSPFDHLEHLRESLCEGGQVILETLVIDAPRGKVLVPGERYAQMRNVWFIPSVLELMHWMRRVGFKHVECVDCTVTTSVEQRTTSWMPFHSLREFLDPVDQSKTIEGYSAPLRAIISATK